MSVAQETPLAEPTARQPRRFKEPVDVTPLALAFVWTLVAVSLWGLAADPDLWGHLRFGADVLRDGTLPTADPYSFTSDIAWVNHEWLSEAQMALAFNVAGSWGLYALKFLLAGAVCVILSIRIRRLPLIIQAPMIVVTMWAAIPIVTTMRPQIWSYALTAALAAMLTRLAPSRHLWWIPALFAVWVNVHGGWLVGGWLLAAWGATKILDPLWRPWVLAISVSTLLATLVNPYGIHLWTFLASTVGLQRDIQEWRPLTAAPLSDWWPWIVATLAFATVELCQQRKSPWRILTLAVLAYASFRVIRLVPFFLLVSAIYLAAPIEALIARHRWRIWRPLAPSRAAASLMLLPSVALAAATAPALVSNGSCIAIRGDWTPDRQTAMALQQAKPKGRMVTAFGWGQYVIWHFGPGLQISLDGRRETAYSPQWMEDLWNIEAGLPGSLPLLARLRPEYVWLPARETGAVRRWLIENGYRVDLETERAWIAVRNDVPPVVVPAAPASSCFPG